MQRFTSTFATVMMALAMATALTTNIAIGGPLGLNGTVNTTLDKKGLEAIADLSLFGAKGLNLKGDVDLTKKGLEANIDLLLAGKKLVDADITLPLKNININVGAPPAGSGAPPAGPTTYTPTVITTGPVGSNTGPIYDYGYFGANGALPYGPGNVGLLYNNYAYNGYYPAYTGYYPGLYLDGNNPLGNRTINNVNVGYNLGPYTLSPQNGLPLTNGFGFA